MKLHAPAAQDAPVVFVLLLHAAPHFPQLPTLVSGSVHCAAQHWVLAPMHAAPHAPQLSGSAFVSMQRPLQHVDVPLAQVVPCPTHVVTHVPAGLHCKPPVQSPLTVHCTHWWRCVLQNGAVGLSAAHSVLALHPGAHWCDGKQ